MERKTLGFLRQFGGMLEFPDKLSQFSLNVYVKIQGERERLKQLLKWKETMLCVTMKGEFQLTIVFMDLIREKKS